MAGQDSRVEAFNLQFGYGNNEEVPQLHVHSGGTVFLYGLTAVDVGEGLSGLITVEGQDARLAVNYLDLR